MSNSSIMSVREMIDSAFGESENNTVHFKLIQTILYILARQLRLLERRVGLVAPLVQPSASSLSITEIKLKANVKKKKKIQSPSGAGKRPVEKSTEKSSSSKTTSDQTQSSTSKSTTKTSTDPSSSSKSTTTKTTTETSSSKTSSDPTKTTTETSTDKTSSSRTKSSSKSTSSQEKRKKEFYNMLQSFEEEREREIRIIHQVRPNARADSHEDAVTFPTPMASVDTMEVQYEKLLIVERIPSDEARSTRGRKKGSAQVSVVTQEQFDELAKSVCEIQNKFGATGKADFPENAELMQELRRGASLTDAMAALQLSARLEAAEKTLQQMITLVTDLAVRKGVNLDLAEDQEDTPAPKTDSRPSEVTPSKSSKVSKAAKSRESSVQASKSKVSNIELHKPEALVDTNVEESIVPTGNDILEIELKKSKIKQNLIQSEDLENALKELYDGILKAVNNITNKTTANAENALKTAIKLEGKLEKALDLGDRMNDLEAIVSQYVEQINVMDTNLSSQMTNYQEQLTQMQHDLESGLEAMAEAMANTGGDTVAVAELNAHFTDLQVDFDSTNTRQKELKEYQDSLALDLQALLKQIELLRETKSDRDEVADALRDKAGLGALNGLVTLQQFNAVRGDFEKRIGAAYDKFNNQEIIWQKAIDDLLRELHEKADLIQVMSLRDDVNNHLEKLRNRIRAMMEIVGEPRSAAVTRKLFRDTNCISCSTPANMAIEETGTFPILPGFPKPSKRPPTIGAEDESKPNESGDFVCYPGLPIPHPIDERAHVCHRYCGGSHTVVSSTLSRAPTGMIITSMPHNTSTALGTDGKVYKVDDSQQPKKPCIACNQPHVKNPEPSEADTAPHDESDMMPWDYQEFTATDIAADITPPPPADDLD